MKTQEQIHDQITRMMDGLDAGSFPEEEKERIMCAIDALLWVVGDRSGGPIYLEYPSDWRVRV